jgi:sRNA-binding carbon storage regulator CsrA
MLDLNAGQVVTLDAFGTTVATVHITEVGRNFVRIGIKARKNVRIRRD